MLRTIFKTWQFARLRVLLKSFINLNDLLFPQRASNYTRCKKYFFWRSVLLVQYLYQTWYTFSGGNLNPKLFSKFQNRKGILISCVHIPKWKIRWIRSRQKCPVSFFWCFLQVYNLKGMGEEGKKNEPWAWKIFNQIVTSSSTLNSWECISYHFMTSETDMPVQRKGSDINRNFVFYQPLTLKTENWRKSHTLLQLKDFKVACITVK